MTPGVEANDPREMRCRRLGHVVSFKYCRTQADNRPCPCTLDCWWEVFDVRGFLEAHAPDQLQTIENAVPISRIGTIVDMVRQAQRQAQADAARQGTP